MSSDSRTAIVKAAGRLLAENGAAVTLEQVARAAGVSRQAIYLHFANRNALVVAVADDARQHAGLAERTAALTEATTPRALLEGFARIAATFHAEVAEAELGMEALCRIDAELAEAWGKRAAGRETVARKVVEQLAAMNALALPAREATDLLWALSSASLFDLLVRQRRWSVRSYETHLVRVLEAALVSNQEKPHGSRQRRPSRPAATRARVEPR
jgi:AcrR family transcriptional regulator